MDYELIKYDVTEASLTTLKNKYAVMPDVKTKEGYSIIRNGITEIRDIRIKIEKKRKELKTDALEWGRKVDSEAKKITTILLEIEAPMKKFKIQHDDQIKAEKEAKKKAEEERKRIIIDKIQVIQAVLLDCVGKNSVEIKKIIYITNAVDISIFEEFKMLAESTKKNTLLQLNNLYTKISLAEQEEKRRKEKAVKLAKEKEEFEREKARLKADREAIEKREKKFEAIEQKEKPVIPQESPKKMTEVEILDEETENSNMIIEIIHEDKGTFDANIDIIINDKCEISACSLEKCPKDANLVRSLNFVYSFVPLLKKAYECGKNGGLLTITEKDI